MELLNWDGTFDTGPAAPDNPLPVQAFKCCCRAIVAGFLLSGGIDRFETQEMLDFCADTHYVNIELI